MEASLRVVYDLRTQPFSVGDVLVYQQTALCLTKNPIDFVISAGLVGDPNLAHITAKDLEWLLPAARVNQRLRSVHYGTDEGGDWPPRDSPYMFYKCIEIIRKHNEEFGIEPVKPLPEMEAWAKEYLGGRTTIQLRRNPWNPERNSCYGEWIEFLGRRPERFVIVCAPHEVDESLRLPNVEIFASTDTEKICALVEAAPIHLGVSSGPAQMRIYSQKPFCIFKDRMKPQRIPALKQDGDRFRFPWTNDRQSILTCSETADRIETYFEEVLCHR